MITDDRLISFIDGELDGDKQSEMDSALANDAATAHRLLALRNATTTLRAAFNKPMHDGIPDQLMAAVVYAVQKRAFRRLPLWRRIWLTLTRGRPRKPNLRSA